MNFEKIFKDAISVIKLNRETIKQVGEDKDSLVPAIIIVAIGGILSSIRSTFFIGFIGIMFSPLYAVVGSFIGAGIIYVIAYLLGGRGSFISLYKVLGYASILSWANIVPIIGWLPSIWIIVVAIVALQVILSMSQVKAIFVFVILFLISLILGMGIYTTTNLILRKLNKFEITYNRDKIEINSNEDENKNITTDTQNKETTSISLPDNFPSDIPVPDNSRVNATMSVNNGNNVIFLVQENIKTVKENYKEKLKNNEWKIIFDLNVDKGTSITAQKNNKQISIQIIENSENETTISIFYQ